MKAEDVTFGLLFPIVCMAVAVVLLIFVLVNTKAITSSSVVGGGLAADRAGSCRRTG